jgi:hypothetical protein
VAEPHDYGVRKGITRALVYQLHANPPGKDKPIGWRMLDTAKIEAPILLDKTFAGSRGTAHRQHYEWNEVFARVT